jgi:hypothetical protein
MDIKELVQVKAKNGCIGCVAYIEMKQAIAKRGRLNGTICEQIGACSRGSIWVERDENEVRQS